MKKYYIYRTQNLINHKYYIGRHYGELDDSYLGSGTSFKEDLKKFGASSFKKEILYISETAGENAEKERYFIKKYNAVSDNNYYNISNGCDNNFVGEDISQEKRKEINKKISEKNKGENHWSYGKHLSAETRRKISESCKSYWTEERKKEQSLKYLGEKNPMYGKKKSKEAIAKQVAHTDYSYTQTESYRKKMSLATSGEKNGNYGNKGEKAKNGKQVYMYDENKCLIKEFNTVNLALEFLNLKGHSGLYKALKEGTLYKGYYWSKSQGVETIENTLRCE